MEIQPHPWVRAIVFEDDDIYDILEYWPRDNPYAKDALKRHARADREIHFVYLDAARAEITPEQLWQRYGPFNKPERRQHV